MNPAHWPQDVRVAAAVMVVVALLGGAATDIGPWYFALQQPAWKPPDWVFGPAWTLIYITTAWAGVRTWRRLSKWTEQGWFLLTCAINGVLNVLWSVLYFTLRRPDLAFFEGLALWCSAALVVSLMARVDRASVWLMVPHLGWVALAVALNLSTVRLNDALWSGG